MKYTLKEDIYSNFGKRLYGKKGTIVKSMSAETGTVILVEDEKGSCFPVRLEKLEEIHQVQCF